MAAGPGAVVSLVVAVVVMDGGLWGQVCSRA